MNMNIWKKMKAMSWTLLCLSTFGLIASPLAYADPAVDADFYCAGCHNGLTVSGTAVAGGERICPQRTAAEWVSTIDRMNGKGCAVPSSLVAGIANYLAGLGGTTTTTAGTTTTTAGTTTTTAGTTTTTAGTTTTTRATTTTTAGTTTTTPATTTTTVASTTTTTASGGDPAQQAAQYCTGCHDGLTVTSASGATLGIVAGGARDCPQRTAAEWISTIDRMNGKGCGAPNVSGIANYLASLGGTTTTTMPPPPTTTTTGTGATTTTTVATTTTTTVAGCINYYPNGTTQYPYERTGTCHGHGSEVINDQKWCKQHMDHTNSSGNHTHSKNHPPLCPGVK